MNSSPLGSLGIAAWVLGLSLAGWLSLPETLQATDFILTSSEQQSGTKVTLLDTFFLNSESGWTVGAGGTILHTQDGGKTWKSVPRRTMPY